MKSLSLPLKILVSTISLQADFFMESWWTFQMRKGFLFLNFWRFVFFQIFLILAFRELLSLLFVGGGRLVSGVVEDEHDFVGNFLQVESAASSADIVLLLRIY